LGIKSLGWSINITNVIVLCIIIKKRCTKESNNYYQNNIQEIIFSTNNPLLLLNIEYIHVGSEDQVTVDEEVTPQETWQRSQKKQEKKLLQ
jgi:hypothetical protein